MTELIRTLTRIKAQCNRHENCTNCIFQREIKRRSVPDGMPTLVKICMVVEAFKVCMFGNDVLPPTDWDIEGFKKEINGTDI